MRPLAAAAIVCVACTSPTGIGTTGTATTNTTSTYTPVTGIEVDAHDLFLRQGCGTSPGQVYKYSVVVFQKTNATPCQSGAPKVVGAGTYDCFADAVFVNLGSGTALGLSNDFDVLVDAFDEPTYAAQAGFVGSTVQDLAINTCPAGAVDDRVTALAQAANWTTTCTAHQQPNVQSLAACGPLVPNVADAGTGD
jgi:hypothetical protein